MLNKISHLPQYINISVFQAMKVRQVMKTEFYSLLLMEHGGHYRLIDFGPNTIERHIAVSIHNHRQDVPVTSPRTIELSHRLYPSLDSM